MTRFKWNLLLVRVEKVQILTQEGCAVCAKRTIGLDSVINAPMVLLGDKGQVEAHSVRVEIVLILKQDRCAVCAERTIGSEIILVAPDRTPR